MAEIFFQIGQVPLGEDFHNSSIVTVDHDTVEFVDIPFGTFGIPPSGISSVFIQTEGFGKRADGRDNDVIQYRMDSAFGQAVVNGNPAYGNGSCEGLENMDVEHFGHAQLRKDPVGDLKESAAA